MEFKNPRLTRRCSETLQQENPDCSAAVVITGTHNNKNYALCTVYMTKNGDFITAPNTDLMQADNIRPLIEKARAALADKTSKELPLFSDEIRIEPTPWVDARIGDDMTSAENYKKHDPSRETEECRVVYLSKLHLTKDTLDLLEDSLNNGARAYDSRLERNTLLIEQFVSRAGRDHILVGFHAARGRSVRGPQDLIDCINWANGLGYQAILFEPAEHDRNTTSALPQYDE